mmetsp:Transcript_1657/g.2288  ORF Transcript_1657/g.2288 Transcript_1657/m.2288 type:complete len:213 (-) Transcript_1657:14-652(-)
MSKESNDIWVFYYVQGEEGDSMMCPNAFQVPISVRENGSIRYGEFLRTFPLANLASYHFRFRVPDQKFGYVWQDIKNPATLLPVHQKVIFSKVLRLDKLPVPPSASSRLRRKPLRFPSQGPPPPTQVGGPGGFAQGGAGGGGGGCRGPARSGAPRQRPATAGADQTPPAPSDWLRPPGTPPIAGRPAAGPGTSPRPSAAPHCSGDAGATGGH